MHEFTWMMQDDGMVLRSLPNSLKMKFTNNKYSHVFEQNHALFRGCNVLFLNQITVKLKEFYLMPGETMLRQGEMPRELCFVKMVGFSLSQAQYTARDRSVSHQ